MSGPIARICVCHPERKHVARGLCNSCYNKALRAEDSTRVERARERSRRNWPKHRQRTLERYARRTEEEKSEARRRARERNHKNIEHVRERRRRLAKNTRVRRFARLYRVTESEMGRLLAVAQCEVCGSDKDMRVDHDHVSGRVRGRLCSNCNKTLGLVHESVDILLGLAGYISSRKEKCA